MKVLFLFPHSWRKAGLLLFIVSLLVLVLNNCYSSAITNFEMAQAKQGNTTDFSVLLSDVILLAAIGGLLLIGFSKEQTEDEQIAQLRLNCLQWSMYLNYIILFIMVVFVNGIQFLNVMAYNMFTPLLFFILVFRWKMYQLNRSMLQTDAI